MDEGSLAGDLPFNARYRRGETARDSPSYEWSARASIYMYLYVYMCAFILIYVRRVDSFVN